MKISVYTFVRNGIRLDYHVVDMLRHHVAFADEIIVHEGMSTDGTYEAIRDLDPKIQVFRSNWDANAGLSWVNRFKDEARRRCRGDWCVLLDADEFIPEWEFERLRARMMRTDQNLLGMSLINFYGNYRVYNAFPEKFRMPFLKMNIHRNLPDIEMHGGDASSVRQAGREFVLTEADAACTLHHFGAVRRAARLREQWRNMRGRLYNAPEPKLRMPSWIFDLLPHNWKDPDFLPFLKIYEGEICRAVRENPDEFTRDGMQLYRYLASART